MTKEGKITLLRHKRKLSQTKLDALPADSELRGRYEQFIAQIEAEIADLGGVP